MAWYAWSPINKVDPDTNRVSSAVAVGDTVSKADYKEDWDYMVETGVVREQKYPDIDDNVSPTEYYRALASQAATGQLSGGDIASLQEFLLTTAIDPGAGIPPPDVVEETDTSSTGGSSK